MSRPLCLLMETDRVFVLARDSDGSAASFAWRPEEPAPLVDALRAEFGAPSAVVVIVGLAFLEIAEPQLPPVANAVRVRMLQRDSDRYFALREPAAVATDGTVAFAMPSALLASWIDALSAWSPVQAVVTVGEAAALGGHNGRWVVNAGADTRGTLAIRDGRVQEVRRSREPIVQTDRALSIAELAGGAWQAASGPIDRQLLDATLRARVEQQRSRRWWQSAAFVSAALLVLALSADRWRERQLVALQREAQSLEQSTTAARAAQARLIRARSEQTAITAADARTAFPDAPAAVLARLGALLPRDAFITRLDWTGTEWRIDGSANDAAALVPLLDADTHFVSVRAAAPSTRYLENGRPRSSFSLVFQSAGAAAASRGAQ